MHVVILGAGAVGGYFGGRLVQAGYPVTFLVREKRYEQLKEKGLEVKSIHGDFHIHPEIAKSVDEMSQPDLVLVALKNYHLEGAMSQLRELVQKGAKILPLLNGIHHLDVLLDELGDKAVLGGLCYIESTLDEEGRVIQTSPMKDIVFGAIHQASDRLFLNEIEDMFEASGIDVRVSDDILVDMWQKYIFLGSLSGITSALRMPISVAIHDDVTKSFLEDMVIEIFTIAKGRGVGLADDVVDQVMNKMKSLSPSMTSSMHRDLEKEGPMELESLHGALLQMAQDQSIDAPCLRSVYALLHPFRNGIAKKF